MKKILIYIALPLVCMAAACTKSFTDLQQNDNKPSSVPASLLLNGVLNDVYEAPYTDYEKWNQYYLINYDYYGNNRYDFGSGANFYTTLKNVVRMQEEAAKAGLPHGNAYDAMADFFKAYLFTKMSLQEGDIPMTEALQSFDNLTPVYDAQEEVFRQAFAWLDTANQQMTTLIAQGDVNLSGDFYFNNSLAKWQKTVNTLHLRLLIELSKRAGDSDLDIKGQFARIFNSKGVYPLMESADDNFQYISVYPTNIYPNNPGNFGFDALRYNASATYVGLLTQLNDPRVFVTMEPATALVAAGKSPVSFESFVGANPGEDLGAMFTKAGAGQYSLINRHRYYQTYTGEPSIQIGYPEQCFAIAEAINRGWITGNAEEYYKAGIQASMTFYDIPQAGNLTVYFLKSGSPGTAEVAYNTYDIPVDFSAYYSQASVKYAGDNSDGLKQILQQKYLALFRHSGLESYFQYRRTGIPQFTTGPGTGNSERIALRFQYPQIERTANADHYQDAIDGQYNGNDDINGIMWLLK